MSPLLLFPIAILTPVVLTLSLLALPYAAMFGACYLIYAHAEPATATTLLSHWMDGFYVLDVYSHLYTYWRANMATASLLHYTLPLLALPLAGGFAAIWLTRRLLGKLVNIFHMASSGH